MFIFLKHPGSNVCRQSCILIAMLLCVPGIINCNAQQARIDSFLGALQNAKEDTTRAFLLYKVGFFYSMVDPDKGIKFALQGLSLAKQLNWEHGIAEANNNVGICYMCKSDFTRAFHYYGEALTMFKKQNDKKGELKVLGNIGNIYNSKSDFPQSLQYYFLALKYAEELNDKSSTAINLSNIGATYESMKEFQKALEYDLKALKINQDRHDTLKMGNCQSNIGNVYSDLADYPEALKYDLSALEFYKHLGNNEGIIRTMSNIGIAYSDLKNYDSALDYYFKSLIIAQKTDFKGDEAILYNLIGRVYILITRDSMGLEGRNNGTLSHKRVILKKAIEYLDKSIMILTTIGRLDYLQDSYRYLSEAQAMAGDFNGALQSYKQYTVLKDSIYSNDNKIKIENLETKRELDLKDKQIQIEKLEVARKRNERAFFILGIGLLLIVIVIVIRNIKLAAARESSENKLSAFQARMNPHFIFNSLNSIQYLVLNKETELSVDYLAEFSTLMRKILDNSGKSKVLLNTEIEMLRSYIQLEHLRFDYFTWDINIAANVSGDNTEIPGMIVQPFVENAILHGIAPKGEGGMLNITFERNARHIICVVEDNGIGRKKSYELNKNNNKGHQSHGVDIAINRLALLNDRKKGLVNKITYIDKEENGIATGTKVIIEIPIL